MERKGDKRVINEEVIQAKLALARKKKDDHKKKCKRKYNATARSKKTSTTKPAPAKKAAVTKHRLATEATSLRGSAKSSTKTCGPEKSASARRTKESKKGAAAKPKLNEDAVNGDPSRRSERNRAVDAGGAVRCDPPRGSERKPADSGRCNTTSHPSKNNDRADGGGAVELGKLQMHLEDKRAREKKKKKDSNRMIPECAKTRKKKSKSQEDRVREKNRKKDSKRRKIPASAKKRKKKSKAQMDREKRQKEEQAQHEIADMLCANIEKIDYFPRNGGELCSIRPQSDFDEVHRIVRQRDSQFSEVIRNKPINVMDLLNCQLPSKRPFVVKYVTEVVKRAWNCIVRSQFEDALKIVNRGIVCCIWIEGDNDVYLNELFRLRLHTAELDSRLLKGEQLVQTLLRVMAEFPAYTVSYDMLRSIFGDDQSDEKLDSLLGLFRQRVESGDYVLPSDIKDEIGTEKTREVNLLANFQDDWSGLCLSHRDNCGNCKRMNFFADDRENELAFDFYTVYTDNIRSIRNGLLDVGTVSKRRNAQRVYLCSECHACFWKCKKYETTRTDDWSCIWPSFYWNLLSGCDRVSGKMFTETYGAEFIWKILPDTLRSYWRPAVAALGCYPIVFYGCEEPSSFFRDVTSSIAMFRKQIKTYTFEGMLSVLEPSRLGQEHPTGRPIMIPDCKCPWGCSEFSFATSHMNPALLLQHLLSKVQLNLPSRDFYSRVFVAETMRLDYFRNENEEEDVVLLNEDWPIRPTMKFVPDEGMMICTCRHHDRDSVRKRLYCHPPRKHGTNLSSTRECQLAVATVQQRYARSVRRKGINTTPTSCYSNMSHDGFSTSNVQLFDRSKPWLDDTLSIGHQVDSLCRPDIRQLLDSYVRDRKFTAEYAECLRKENATKITPEVLESLTRGASYCPTHNALQLQKTASLNNEHTVVVEEISDDGERKTSQAGLRRNWCSMIYNVMTQDGLGYGCRMKPIPLREMNNPGDDRAFSCIAAAFVACVGSINMLYHYVDEKKTCHSYDNFSGYLLTFIHNTMMMHCDRLTVPLSPFNSAKFDTLCTSIRGSISGNFALSDDPVDNMSLDVFENLFPERDYPSVRVCADWPETPLPRQDKIIMVLCDDISSMRARYSVLSSEYEARCVVSYRRQVQNDSLSYELTHYARHSGNHKWWFQSHKHHVMVQSDHISDDGTLPPFDGEWTGRLLVYVLNEQVDVDRYKVEIFKSLGGQDRLFCGCDGTVELNPYMVSGRRQKEREKCCAKNCNQREKYVCHKCDVKICGRCQSKLVDKERRITLDNRVLLVLKDYGIDNAVRTTRGVELDDMDRVLSESHDSNDGLGESTDDEKDAHPYSDDVPGSIGEACGDNVDLLDESNIYDTNCGDTDALDASVCDSDSGGSNGFDWEQSDADEDNDDDVPPLKCRFGDEENEDEWFPPDDNERSEDKTSDMAFYDYGSDSDESCDGEDDAVDAGPELDPQTKNHMINANASLFGRHHAVAGVRFDPRDHLVTRNDYPTWDPDSFGDSRQVYDDPLTTVPRIDCSIRETPLLQRGSGVRHGMHVLFNFAGTMLRRSGKPMSGNMLQNHFVQSLASTIYGVAFPILFLQALLFPKHFWCSPALDPMSTFGCPPISCYRGSPSHLDGFASPLERARNLCTHSSSSTATDDRFTSYLWDQQANLAGNGYDSRIIQTAGFTVDKNSPSGLGVGERDKADLRETLESSQALMNLAGVSVEQSFDLFLTYTANQKEHPGLGHLWAWKESERWRKHIKGFHGMFDDERDNVRLSMEMAYTQVLTRCWLEVRAIWIDFIMNSVSSLLGSVIVGFFRDEYQESSGNLSHIHALVGLDRRAMDNEEFIEFVGRLQKNCVGDILPSYELEDYMKKGLISNLEDWGEMKRCAHTYLPHRCDSKRCLVKSGPRKGQHFCKKIDPHFASVVHEENEFQPLPTCWSDDCKSILERIGLYTPPTDSNPWEQFHHPMFVPTRHVGMIHPNATENISPVLSEHFCFTRSAQNAQVIVGTGGVTRYVVKYIVKIDKCNRAVVWSDVNNGSVLRVEYENLHNTKISSNAIHTKTAFENSKKKSHPFGRVIGTPQMLHNLLGYSEITMKNINCVEVSTLPFEFRGRAKVRLDKSGNLQQGKGKAETVRDGVSVVTESCSVRQAVLRSCVDRQFTDDQRLLLTNTEKEHVLSDHVTTFGVRPPELLHLVRRLGMYHKMFVCESDVLGKKEIEEGLHTDVKRCRWIDGVGRIVRLRKSCVNMFVDHLRNLDPAKLPPFASSLRDFIISSVDDRRVQDLCHLTCDDGLEFSPVVIFSRITPDQHVKFALHLLLVLGEYDTELDFRKSGSFKDCFVKAGLFDESMPNDRTVSGGELAVDRLMKRVVLEVVPVQPVSTKKLDTYIVRSNRVLRSMLLDDCVPLLDLPPCLQTQLYADKHSDMMKCWDKHRRLQLKSMLEPLSGIVGVPALDDVFHATKEKPVIWNPLEAIPKLAVQSDDSFQEQQFALGIGKRAVDSYLSTFGCNTVTKGVLCNGAPGAGKTYLLQTVGLYAMSMGLRVMTTALMATRARTLGGLNIHQLFKWDRRNNGNLFRLSQLSKDRLNSKANIVLKHIMMTMDVLLLDECGQLSSQQLSIMDIVLRHLRENDMPFGGVLIIGSFDHKQLGSVDGLPFLLNHHIISDFTVVRLEQSVRAAEDEKLQRIQRITRMSAYTLRRSKELHQEFYDLVSENINFAESMSELNPNTQRMYHRKKSAALAINEFVNNTIEYLKKTKQDYVVSESVDFKAYNTSSSGVIRIDKGKERNLVSLLDRKAKECRRLVFFKGAIFEATCNIKKNGVMNTQNLIMLDVPSDEVIANKRPITLYAAEPGSPPPDCLFYEDPPTEETVLKEWGWTKVELDVVPENFHNGSGVKLYRQQYPLTHPGASTVNKQMGCTILMDVALEVTDVHKPWESGQVVVGLSRTKSCKQITIVTNMEREGVVKALWDCLCKVTQWTAMVDSIIDRMAVCAGTSSPESCYMDMTQHYPFRTCDYTLPQSFTGYVYLLVSMVCHDEMYVGQTGRNMPVRLSEHNSGKGSYGTECSALMPWGVAAYIDKLSHMNVTERMRLEGKWKDLNYLSKQAGTCNIHDVLLNGKKVVDEYNATQNEPEKRISFHKCVEFYDG